MFSLRRMCGTWYEKAIAELYLSSLLVSLSLLFACSIIMACYTLISIGRRTRSWLYFCQQGIQPQDAELRQ